MIVHSGALCSAAHKAHNHPSSQPVPSAADKRITERILLRFDYEIFLDDDIDADDLDDISQLPNPKIFTRELLLNDVHTRDYAVGRVEFGRYGGRKVVIEQNASPLLVYWKGE